MWSFEIGSIKRLAELGTDLEYLMQFSSRLQPVPANGDAPTKKTALASVPQEEPEFQRLVDDNGRLCVPAVPELEAWFQRRAPASFTLMSITQAIYEVSEVEAHARLYRAEGGSLGPFGNTLRDAVGNAFDALKHERWPVTVGRTRKGNSGRKIWSIGLRREPES